MIISASRRTDIPAYYSEWFCNRLKEEYVLVRNPIKIHQVSRVSLSPEVVDGIVFWTKNPSPMLKKLNQLEKYNYYFQFTLTAYGSDIEKNLPSKDRVIIPVFQQLSKEIGKEKVVQCIDKERFEKMGNYRLAAGKDKNQRRECGCMESIDIGAYDTCQNGCLYCYANASQSRVDKNCRQHDPESPLLFGELDERDTVKERKVRSFADRQMTLLDY